ncbi:MAG: hypothetical protein C4530_24135 [Desulfobacteraceae bacterium]|nr:MAG: hypothetical protein C4530_24135 [Desulfobacteraceae bacterium]
MGMLFQRTEDPGKDLYAYLYITTLIFCIMFVTADKLQNALSQQPGPEKTSLPVSTTLSTIPSDKLGRLVKESGTVFLVYGITRYRPAQDAGKLEADSRIVKITDAKGAEKKMLYLEAEPSNRVLLSEYLSAFGDLGSSGIGITFAEKIK